MSKSQRHERLRRTDLLPEEAKDAYLRDVERYIEKQEEDLDNLKAEVRRNIDSFKPGDVIFLL